MQRWDSPRRHALVRHSSLGAGSFAPAVTLEGAGMDRDRLNGLVSVLSEFASTVLTDFSLQAILDHLVERVVELLPVTAAGVTLISSDLTPHHVAASNEAALRFEQLQTELGQGPCVAAYASSKPVAVPDLARANGFPDFGPAAAEAGMAAVFAFPLRHAGGCLGALDLYRSTTGALAPEDLAVAQTLADVTTSYLLNAQTRERALQAADRFRDSALHDPLTGLPNRVLLQERLDHAALRASRTGKTTAVLFADLDGFKLINDTYGHAVGDQLLAAVASRLSALVRPGDTLARVSGDEFVFLCEDLAYASDVELLTTRIEAAFAEPFELHDLALTASASVGAAFSGPGEAVTNQLVLDADTAMYQAKRRASSNLIVDLTSVHSVREHHELQSALSAALLRGELDIVYQPIVRTADGLLNGVEALLRWPNPAQGTASAASALDIAEQNGLLVDVGAWILDRACRDHVNWVAGHRERQLDLSVNISALQLTAPGFCAMVASVLDATDMDPTALVLEMGERIFLEDSRRATSVLADLKSLGIRLALDNFGKDHCSLNQLRRLPLDIIKIDKSLVADIGQNNAASIIVGAVTQLARGLGMTVTAEGVETELQHHEAAGLGCELGQGFHYGRPVGGPDVSSLLNTSVDGPVRDGPGQRDRRGQQNEAMQSAGIGSATPKEPLSTADASGASGASVV